MEVELQNEQHHHNETQKSIRKQDRRMKELAVQADEDHKSQGRMQDMVDKLQNRIKIYKRQVEEAVSRPLHSIFTIYTVLVRLIFFVFFAK